MADTVTKSIIVKGKVADIYNVWANFANFPHFMKHITSVEVAGDRRSHWVVEGPLGTKLEWDAEITRLENDSRIAWKSVEASPMKTSGQVTFKQLPHDETEITVTMLYVPPAGAVGQRVADLFSDPDKMLRDALRNFKAYVEGQDGNARGDQ